MRNTTAGFYLIPVRKTDTELVALRQRHYTGYAGSGGVVGRALCYLIETGPPWKVWGGIIAGSACLHLPGRDEFFGLGARRARDGAPLTGIVNNVFFRLERDAGERYPLRNFGPRIIEAWRNAVARDWLRKYGDPVVGFETLVEPPRTGEVYIRDGWKYVGTTQGYTCKRGEGHAGEGFTVRRTWNTSELHPKLVFCRGNT